MLKNTKLLLIIISMVVLVASCYYSLNKKINKKINKIILEKTSQLENKIDQLVSEKIVKAEFADFLKVYTVYDADGLIKLIRIGKDGDGGYAIPETSLKNAQALLGYGVADDISFEEQFSTQYNKESYGFDCSIKQIDIKNKLTHFIPECLATGNFIYGKLDNVNVSSFKQQLKTLNLEEKKIFIKMDIEGAEYEVFPEVLKNAKNITGIVMELHLDIGTDGLNKAMKLLSSLNQDFFLVSVHGNNCGIRSNHYTFTTPHSKGNIPRLLELTYINKNLVSKAHIGEDQSHPAKIDMPNCKDLEDPYFEIQTRSN